MGIRKRLLRPAVMTCVVGLGLMTLGFSQSTLADQPIRAVATTVLVQPQIRLVSHECCLGNPWPVVVDAPRVAPVPVVAPVPAVAWSGPIVQYVPRTPDVAPPPGTLGRTYRKPSRPIPYDKHPRIGMADVEILEDTQESLAQQYADAELKVTASDIKRFFKPLEGYLGTDGIWHFESQPLYPGIPHIYDVKFEMVRKTKKVEIKYGRRVEYEEETKVDDLGYRRIRLIPGRIVDLSF